MPKASTDTPRRKADSDENIALIIKDIIEGKAKPGKYSEGNIKGLFLKANSTSQLWRLKYSLNGEENTYSIGIYPDISVAQARILAQEARTAVANGIAPRHARAIKEEAKKAQEAWTFKKVAEEWLEFNSHLKPKTVSGHRGALKNHIYPSIGDMPVAEIAVRHIRTILERLNASSPTMARYSLTLMRMILNRAMDNELVSQNVAIGREGLLKKHKTKHHAALTTPEDLKEFIRRLNGFVAFNDPVISALWLLLMLPVRPAELTAMKWEQVNLDAGEWRYTVPKTGQPFIVPLPNQAIGQLRLIKEYSDALNRKGLLSTAPFGKIALSEVTNPPTWVFPSSGKFGVPISADTLLVRIRTGLGYERGAITSHGFRSTFRTLGEEVLEIDQKVLELCLGHRVPGALGATYARAQLLDQRREAMQKWADYIEELWTEATNYGNDDGSF